MCTLSFVPTSAQTFLLTSNRDESVSRMLALAPAEYEFNQIKLVYPKDMQAGGTWLTTADNGLTLCLLNGAFTKHKRRLPYKHSRGLVVLDFFKFMQVDDFLHNYDFAGIEPFTLVVIDAIHSTIHEIRWDEQHPHVTLKNWNQPHIWSSVTLYEPDIIEQREHWFYEILKQHAQINIQKMLHFHHFGGNDDEANRLLMNRNNKLKTVSITGINKTTAATDVHHYDLLNNERSVLTLR
ncbi:MAG: NRDE family protein [Bacteroidia bacterium]|jgi:hypothetical protein|nr:NRDE family protein [Bacteroidia bacterium]